MATIEEQETAIQQELREQLGLSFGATASVKPKLILADMANGDEFEVPYNPTNLVTTFTAKYTKFLPAGDTSDTMHYDGTHSPAIPLELMIFRKALDGVAGSGFLQDIQEIQRFLMSLMYPVEMASTVASSAPPRVLVIWPNEISVVARVEKLTLTRRQFRNTDLRSILSEATMSITPIRGSRVSSEEMRETGLQWPGEIAF